MTHTKETVAGISVLAGFALLMASSLLVRGTESQLSSTMHEASRIAETIACLALAASSCRVRVSDNVLLATAGCFWAASSVLGVGATFSTGYPGLAVVLSGLADGVLVAFTTMLFAVVMCRMHHRPLAAAIPMALAFSHVVFWAASSFDVPETIVRPVLQLLALAALFWGSRVFPDVGEGASLRPVGAAPVGIKALVAGESFAVVLGAFVFPLVYGFVAQASSLGGEGGLFSQSIEIVGTLFLVLIALASVVFPGELDGERMFLVVFPAFATAMLLIPLFWGSEPFVGGFVVKCGFAAFYALTWTYLQRTVRTMHENPFLFFGVILAIYRLSIIVGRRAGAYLLSFTDPATIGTGCLVAVWVLSMAALAVLASRIRGRSSSSFVSVSPPATFDTRFDQFARKYDLSDRETAVSREFARGRTIAYIANSLSVSQETVKTYLKRTYAKTDCHSRQDLIDAVEEAGGPV